MLYFKRNNEISVVYNAIYEIRPYDSHKNWHVNL